MDKQWVRDYLQNLYEMLLSARKKKEATTKEGETDNKEVDKSLNVSCNSSSKTPSKKQTAEDRQWKRHQDAVMKEIEMSLIEQFDSSRDAFYLNLIFIENCRDYGVNKYNTLSCLVAKTFDKWLIMPPPTQSDNKPHQVRPLIVYNLIIFKSNRIFFS